MAVYVDAIKTYPRSMLPIKARKYGTEWCHLTGDNDAELHRFARKLGLSLAWAQHFDSPQQFRHHYDLVPSKRALAVQNGAIEVEIDPLMRRWINNLEVARRSR